MFKKLYDQAIRWSRHRHATKYLAILSFAESSFFPVPPDVMLAPMVLAQQSRALRLASITTIASVLGGMLGYAIGFFAFDLIQPWLEGTHYWPKYQLAEQWFKDWGFWAIFVAGFSPIPYKVFTIAAGALSMTFVPFVFASFVGRGMRFFLVAGLLAWGGERFEAKLRQYMDVIGWAVVVLIIIGVAVYKFINP
ncbi:MAG: DedA family protein [Gammaproteobacteria bacterium]|jgi:membrane protein YqaA with SNARE-associated domain|nr:DedA family protein [Gammaproteobacteria bacterium]MBT4145404.1 DedA family protein [Gammaproteobacteria bacterium]MBT5222119.1 DedA family protein [Gammaproteobacteria bacterium]MBT5825604.1 DedA family protein [Gammaproteobacteria bacterium]MBT6420881.1 DedA family protein [Gammaproteobacteria bacterium]